MPPRLDFIGNLLDLNVFFLVTPNIIGEDREQAFYAWMGTAVHWLRTVYFNRELGPASLAMLATLVTIYIVGILAVLRISLSDRSTLLNLVIVIHLPFFFKIFYWAIGRLERILNTFIVFAVFSAVLFAVSRVIVIDNAWTRM